MKTTILYIILALVILAIVVGYFIYSYNEISDFLGMSFWEAVLLFAVLKIIFWIIYSLFKG